MDVSSSGNFDGLKNRKHECYRDGLQQGTSLLVSVEAERLFRSGVAWILSLIGRQRTGFEPASHLFVLTEEYRNAYTRETSGGMLDATHPQLKHVQKILKK